MELFSFRFTSYALIFICTFWSVTNISIAATQTPPVEDVESVIVVSQTNTSVTVQFEEVVGIPEYILYYGTDGQESIPGGNTHITYTVHNLSPAQKYHMTLRSKAADGQESAGFSFSASTAPSEAQEFKKVTETETSITLQWENDNKEINYILKFDGRELSFTGEDLGDPATHTVPGLQNATRYTFTLVTVFDDILGEEMNISTATAPRNTEQFVGVAQIEDSIVLWWSDVSGITEYIIQFGHEEIQVTGRNDIIIENLSSGTLYNFTLYTVFEDARSSGFHAYAGTAPPKVSSVTVTERIGTNITLEWPSVRNDLEYLVESNNRPPERVDPKEGLISHTLHSLNPGTIYLIIIYAVFKPLPTLKPIKSRASETSILTAIDCTEVSWRVTDTTIRGTVYGLFNSATVTNGTQQHNYSGHGPNIHFSGLYPGANYSMKVMFGQYEQCTHSFTTVPPMLTAKCKNWNRGYSIYIEWDSPWGVWDSVEVIVSGKEYELGYSGELHAVLPDFQPAKKYQVSVSSRSGRRRSSPYVFICKTDDRGVIAGAFFGVLLFILLVCAVVFLVRRRPDIIRRNK